MFSNQNHKNKDRERYFKTKDNFSYSTLRHFGSNLILLERSTGSNCIKEVK